MFIEWYNILKFKKGNKDRIEKERKDNKPI